VVLLLIGGGLMVKDFFIVETKHEAEFLGVEFSVTEERRKTIPLMLSGTILVVGAIVTVLGVARGKTAGRTE
jgi:hypothetical protein